MDQALNSQKTPHTSPLRASYGMSFVSILMKNDRVIKGFYCKCYPIIMIDLSELFRHPYTKWILHLVIQIPPHLGVSPNNAIGEAWLIFVNSLEPSEASIL